MNLEMCAACRDSWDDMTEPMPINPDCTVCSGRGNATVTANEAWKRGVTEYMIACDFISQVADPPPPKGWRRVHIARIVDLGEGRG